MGLFDGASATKVRDIAERVTNKLATMREKTEEVMGQAIQAVEVTGTAAAFGYVNERYGTNGELAIPGLVAVPVDLAVFFGGHLLAFTGTMGKYGEHGHNIADGAGAAYGYRLGAKLGREAKNPAVKGIEFAGWLPPGAPQWQPANPAYAHANR